MDVEASGHGFSWMGEASVAIRSSSRPAVDRADFDAIYRDNAGFLWMVLRRLGVEEAFIEDALQEVFLVVYRRLPTFEGRAPLRSWLYGIALRVARARRRRARVRSVLRFFNEDEEPADPTTGEERVERDDALAVLDGLLGELSPSRREVFVLAEIEGLTAPEIAEIMSSNVNTTYSRIRLARADFEAALARHRARDGFGARRL